MLKLPRNPKRPHPFKVRDDAKIQETVASIKANGVMVPGLARPEKDGNGYEIVAGHRRHHGCELAGLLELEVEDIKHQGGRLKNVAEGDIGKRSTQVVGGRNGMNYK